MADASAQRPTKRHKSDESRFNRRSSEETDAPSPPVDHIFITENLTTKKAGKKVPLSCCECRRLKLKCDRTFPCGSCKKRGVSDICPDGVLVSGKGTRFILANTEQLHTKIHEMSDRIRELEDALRERCIPESHPLLEGDALHIKSTMELYSSSTKPDSKPESSPAKQGQKRDWEHSHAMDVDQREKPSSVANVKPSQPDVNYLEAEIQRLSRCFPFADRINDDPNVSLRNYIRSKLPPRAEAQYLWAQTQENALWQYNPHPTETFFPNLLHHCYDLPIEDVCPRRLALMYMILGVGCLVDLRREAEDPDAERYHTLARASMREFNVMEEVTVEAITALFYEIWFLLVFSDKKKAAGYAWGLMGLTAKMAQSIGLHRNGHKSKDIPEEVERRRSLYWELLYLDARLSLSLGRPPSLSLKHMDCARPSYAPDAGRDLSESLHYYQEWKHSCFIHCLAPVLDAVSQPNLDYKTVMELDAKIRDFFIPLPLQSSGTHAQRRSIIMQRASLATALETVLLQLHRTYFTRALSGPEMAFNRYHMYAPSVVAVFLSATRMIATIQELYEREPQLTARILGYWSNAFSAAVALCLLVSRAPFACLTPATLQELNRAKALFNSAKNICTRAQEVIPVLETMVAKANDIYDRWSAGGINESFLHGEDSEPPALPIVDPFASCHRDLERCMNEAHERAAAQKLARPCACAELVSVLTGPTQSRPPQWMDPPPSSLARASATTTGTRLLPDLYKPNGSRGLSSGERSAMVPPLSPNSKFAVVDTLNFELGALNPSTENSWMAWF